MQLTSDTPLLETRRLEKRFGGVVALDSVSLSIRAGMVTGLIGENGAGKSTLIRCWAGAEQPDGGELQLDGRPVRFSSPADAEAAGFRFIHQDLQLVPYFDAVENCFLGRPYPRRGGLIDWKGMRRQVGAVAEALAPDLPLDVPVARLSAGHRQLVEILRALLTKARLLVLDEPTTALSEQEVARLFAAVRTIRRHGTAVVYVSHRLEEVLALADTIAVMRDGHMVGTVVAADVEATDLVTMMSGDLHRIAPPHAAATAQTLLEVEGLRVGAHDGGMSFRVGRGEIVGLYGLLGSGRSETLMSLFGAQQCAQGHMHLDGRPFRPRSPRQAIKRGVALVPEDRRRQALVAKHSIRANLTLPHLSAFRRGRRIPWVSRVREERFVRRIAQKLSLVFANSSQPVETLSGGNQQKVVAGRWFAAEQTLFLFDEPTKGVDIKSKAEIHDEIRAVASGGAGVLVASSDLEELLDVADRILAVRDGHVAGAFDRAVFSRARILEACYGG